MIMANFSHVPVLTQQVLKILNVQSKGSYVDGTLGGGGHAFEICKLLSKDGKLIGIDCDEDAISASTIKLAHFENVYIVHENFENVQQVLGDMGINNIDGAILDLGVSSYHLDTPNRGFSYKHDALLDMRMDVREKVSARAVVNGYSEKKLAEIIYKNGEERYARSIAAGIVFNRKLKEISTTFELAQIVKKSVPSHYKFGNKHPAKRTFQAIRIEVNSELSKLERAIKSFAKILKPGGILVVISFHSLEDRIVKNEFANLSSGCCCPSDFPVCICGKIPEFKILTKKPILPTHIEVGNNRRAHSAKLRAIEKL